MAASKVCCICLRLFMIITMMMTMMMMMMMMTMIYDVWLPPVIEKQRLVRRKEKKNLSWRLVMVECAKKKFFFCHHHMGVAFFSLFCFSFFFFCLEKILKKFIKIFCFPYHDCLKFFNILFIYLFFFYIFGGFYKEFIILCRAHFYSAQWNVFWENVGVFLGYMVWLRMGEELWVVFLIYEYKFGDNCLRNKISIHLK